MGMGGIWGGAILDSHDVSFSGIDLGFNPPVVENQEFITRIVMTPLFMPENVT